MVESINGKDQNVFLEYISALRPSLHLYVVFLCCLPNLLYILLGQFICNNLISENVLKVVRNKFMKEKGGKEVHSMAHFGIDEKGLYNLQIILYDGVI